MEISGVGKDEIGCKRVKVSVDAPIELSLYLSNLCFIHPRNYLTESNIGFWEGTELGMQGHPFTEGLCNLGKECAPSGPLASAHLTMKP